MLAPGKLGLIGCCGSPVFGKLAHLKVQFIYLALKRIDSILVWSGLLKFSAGG